MNHQKLEKEVLLIISVEQIPKKQEFAPHKNKPGTQTYSTCANRTRMKKRQRAPSK